MRNISRARRQLLIASTLLFMLMVVGLIMKIRHDLGESVGRAGCDLLIFALKRADNK